MVGVLPSGSTIPAASRGRGRRGRRSRLRVRRPRRPLGTLAHDGFGRRLGRLAARGTALHAAPSRALRGRRPGWRCSARSAPPRCRTAVQAPSAGLQSFARSGQRLSLPFKVTCPSSLRQRPAASPTGWFYKAPEPYLNRDKSPCAADCALEGDAGVIQRTAVRGAVPGGRSRGGARRRGRRRCAAPAPTRKSRPAGCHR